jgi:hypothetical protein
VSAMGFVGNGLCRQWIDCCIVSMDGVVVDLIQLIQLTRLHYRKLSTIWRNNLIDSTQINVRQWPKRRLLYLHTKGSGGINSNNTLSNITRVTTVCMVLTPNSCLYPCCGYLLTSFLLRDFYVNSVLVSFDFLATERSCAFHIEAPTNPSYRWVETYHYFYAVINAIGSFYQTFLLW